MNGLVFNQHLFLIVLGISFGIFLGWKIYRNYNRNPFFPPQIEIEFDISYKKNVEYSDYIDNWIIDHKADDYRGLFLKKLDSWFADNEEDLQHNVFLKKHRKKQLEMTRDEALNEGYVSYLFLFVRGKTRYKQVNYQRYSYVAEDVVYSVGFTIEEMEKMRERLREINYAMPLSRYSQQNQRKMMTKELRQKIMLRDNYTCQKCGKHMPDRVGLHIDHIVPISKGGRSVEDNLQVLCDKCNYRKGTK